MWCRCHIWNTTWWRWLSHLLKISDFLLWLSLEAQIETLGLSFSLSSAKMPTYLRYLTLPTLKWNVRSGGRRNEQCTSITDCFNTVDFENHPQSFWALKFFGVQCYFAMLPCWDVVGPDLIWLSSCQIEIWKYFWKYFKL